MTVSKSLLILVFASTVAVLPTIALPSCDMAADLWHGRWLDAPSGPARGRQPCSAFGADSECNYAGCNGGQAYKCWGPDANGPYCVRQDTDAGCSSIADGQTRPGTNPGNAYWCQDGMRMQVCPCETPPPVPAPAACDNSPTAWHGNWPTGPTRGAQPCTLFGSVEECDYEGCGDALGGYGFICSGNPSDVSTLFCKRNDADDACDGISDGTQRPTPNPGNYYLCAEGHRNAHCPCVPPPTDAPTLAPTGAPTISPTPAEGAEWLSPHRSYNVIIGHGAVDEYGATLGVATDSWRGAFVQCRARDATTTTLGGGSDLVVRCCTHAGLGGSNPGVEQPVGCVSGATFVDAYKACAAEGQRLCTQSEVEARASAGTGCGFDDRYHWTSTVCAPALLHGGASCWQACDCADCDLGSDVCLANAPAKCKTGVCGTGGSGGLCGNGYCGSEGLCCRSGYYKDEGGPCDDADWGSLATGPDVDPHSRTVQSSHHQCVQGPVDEDRRKYNERCPTSAPTGPTSPPTAPCTFCWDNAKGRGRIITTIGASIGILVFLALCAWKKPWATKTRGAAHQVAATAAPTAVVVSNNNNAAAGAQSTQQSALIEQQIIAAGNNTLLIQQLQQQQALQGQLLMEQLKANQKQG